MVHSDLTAVHTLEPAQITLSLLDVAVCLPARCARRFLSATAYTWATTTAPVSYTLQRVVGSTVILVAGDANGSKHAVFSAGSPWRLCYEHFWTVQAKYTRRL